VAGTQGIARPGPSSQFLSGRCGVVTGAGSGIGQAVARVCAREGASVLVCDINEDGARHTVSAIRAAGGRAELLVVDVRDEASVQRMVREQASLLGSLDFAVNNAGISGAPGLLAEQSIAELETLVAINLTSIFLCLKYELPAMVSQGGGAIVNTSSQAGFAAQPLMPLYTATKHGVAGLTRAAAVDYVAAGVRVNAICPGVVRTPMAEDYVRRGVVTEESMSATTPIARLAEPEEVAEAAVWLCSDAASYINGVLLPVDGGAHASTV
jgi:NAD(P)-dependent dehydrogenase (short-subunit alcohol dehydrogenase family)